MALKKYKPTSAGRRNMTTVIFKNQFLQKDGSVLETTENRPEKSLLVAQKSRAGRNRQGRITSRFLGGGHKHHYRIIDFKRNKLNIESTVK